MAPVHGHQFDWGTTVAEPAGSIIAYPETTAPDLAVAVPRDSADSPCFVAAAAAAAVVAVDIPVAGMLLVVPAA